MKAVIMTGRKFNIEPVFSDERDNLNKTFEMIDDVTSIEELKTRNDLRNVEIIFSTWGMFSLSKEEIKAYLPNLKAIFYAAGTVQYFAKPFLELGIKVFSAWQANGTPVSEVTFAQIILANKGFYRRQVTNPNEWNNSDKENHYPGNYKTNVGILGAGSIGKKVIKLLKNTDLNVIVFDPFLSYEQANELGVTKMDLVDVFKSCHIISNHIANNEQTKNIIDSKCFDNMQDDAIFINTGRGAQVDKEAFINAMKTHPNRLALVDVLDPNEPPKDGDPIFECPNIIVSPHIAGSIGNEYKRMADFMYNEALQYINNKQTNYEVTLKMLETMA